MKVKSLITLIVKDGEVPPGEVIELNNTEAEYLAERNMVELVDEVAAPAATPAPVSTNTESPPTPPATPSEPVNEEDIIQVMMQLDLDSDFTANGLPKVEVIEQMLEASITAEQRDEAWAKIQETNEVN